MPFGQIGTIPPVLSKPFVDLLPVVTGGVKSLWNAQKEHSTKEIEFKAGDDINLTSYSTVNNPPSVVASKPVNNTYIVETSNYSYRRMPRKYYKRYRKRKSYYPRSGYKNKVPKFRKSMRGYYRREGLLEGGKKYLDTLGITQNPILQIGGAFLQACLTIIPQGVGMQNRIARQAWATKLDCRLVFTLPKYQDTFANFYATRVDDLVRIMVVQDKQTNGTTWNTADLFEGTTQLQEMNNISSYKRFKILYNRTVSLSRGGDDRTQDGTNVYLLQKIFNYNFDLKFKRPIILEYTNGGVTGAITTHVSNSLWLVCISQNGYAILDPSSTVRLRFIDPTK